jgi:hypothetical protein
MSFASLPLELIHQVASHADLPALAALSATSHSFHPAADRELYRHLDLSPSSRSLSAILTLAHTPHLAHHVRSLSLSLPVPYPVLRAYARAIARALQHMPALTELHLVLDPSASWILDLLPSKASYPSLHTFSASFPLDAPVARFLARTPRLTSLALSTTISCSPSAAAPSMDQPTPALTPAAVPPTSIPHLTHFSGALAAAAALAPGRPLVSVHALDGDLSPAAAAALGASLAVLSASTRAPLVPLLHALAARMPALAYLRLTAPLPLTTFPDMVRAHPLAFPPARPLTPAQSFYEDVACALDALPALVDFELAGMHWPSHVDTEHPAPKRVWQSVPRTPTHADADADAYTDADAADDLYEDLDILF